MVYFFYGENTYSIKEKIDQLKDRFAKEQGDFNISEVQGANLTKNEYSGLVFSLPFLSGKRLVIIKNLMLDNSDTPFKKYIAEGLEKVPETTVLIFAEYGLPDKKLLLFKNLKQPKRAQNFELLQGVRLTAWINQKVTEAGAEISRDAMQELQIFVGGDLWRLQNEIEKLVLYKKAEGKKTIESEDVVALVAPTLNPNIFDFISFVANGNNKGAIQVLDQLVESGENEIKILSMVIYQYRIMLQVADLSKKRLSGSEIASKGHIHPFVVRKTQDLLRQYKQDRLEKCYFLIQKVDTDIKSGLIEPNLALLLLVADLKAEPVK